MYTITAIIDPINTEHEIQDNTLVANDQVCITMPGDVDGDRDVDIFDIVKIAGAYGSSEGQPEYVPNSDIDSDRDVDIFDIVVAAGNYEESSP